MVPLAPAIVRAESLMPVRSYVLWESGTVTPTLDYAEGPFNLMNGGTGFYQRVGKIVTVSFQTPTCAGRMGRATAYRIRQCNEIAKHNKPR